MRPDSEPSSPSGSRSKCICLSVAAVILSLGLLCLILGLTVFKVKKPRIAVDHVTLRDLDFGFDLTRFRVLLNVSVDVDASIDNPNRFGFEYKNSNVLLLYRGTDVGEVPLAAGSIPARGSRALNLTLVLLADRLLTNSTLYSDASAGTLPFQTYLRVAGKTRILFFDVHAVSYSTCDFNVSLTNRSIGDRTCRYRTEL